VQVAGDPMPRATRVMPCRETLALLRCANDEWAARDSNPEPAG
jgi:hypothetical protein